MRKRFVKSFVLGAMNVLALGIPVSQGQSDPWPQWRGPLATGEAPHGDPPMVWGEGSNVLWKVTIPGRGHSSPIIWGDRVFLTTTVETESPVDPEKTKASEKELPDWQKGSASLPTHVLEFVVLALKRSDGSVLWKQTVCEEAPHASTHADGSWASGSPVCDGERIFAYFGSYGLHCFDMDGKKLWEKRLGLMKTKMNFGEGVSPALCGDLIIVNWDQEGASYLVALDKKTGEQRWKVDRDEKTSWATPLIAQYNGKRQIVVNATRRIRAYDPTDGKTIWQCGGMTENVIPSPVSAAGIVYCMSGFRGNSIMAIRLATAVGDVTGKSEAIAWSGNRRTPYVPSPLLYAGMLYYLKGNDGVLSCVDATTGRPHYEDQQLEGIKQVYSSPVGAAGRIYVTGRNGVTLVLKKGPAFEMLARNSLNDSFSASAAISGQELYLRGYQNLYCIGQR
jgi:outer membrane protein assembly factor BamB